MEVRRKGRSLAPTGVGRCVHGIWMVVCLAIGGGELWNPGSMTLGYWAFGKLSSSCKQVSLDSKTNNFLGNLPHSYFKRAPTSV